MLPLEGQKIIVTGSTRGIGKVIALQLARDGADIVVCGRSETEGTDQLPGTIRETIAEVEALGREALGVRMDLANDGDLERLIDRTVSEFGRIDALVNNAVIVGPRRPLMGGDADWLDTSYRVNIRAPFRLMQMASAQMGEQGGGAIVNISSRGALNPDPPTEPAARVDSMDPAYPISKAALERITTAYAAELWAHNISLVALRPGLVITERIAQAAIRPNVDVSRAEPAEYTAYATSHLLQHGIAYAGHVVQAKDLVESEQLIPA